MANGFAGIVVGLGLLVACEYATGDTADTPAARAEIERYGTEYPAERATTLKAIYRDAVAAADRPVADAERDIAYGDHPLQTLDVHRPLSPVGARAPVLVFVHGGGFVRGDKSDGVIFDNIMNYYARHGILGVNANYRLAPEFGWPAGARDVGAVVRWIRAHADEYDADPERIFLMGHSAGAVHVATYVLVEALQPADGDDGVAGAILMSGVYSGGNRDSMPVYYGEDESRWAERLPINHVAGRAVPLFIIDAEYDPLVMQQDALNLARAVCERDTRCPRHVQIRGHNHYSMTYHINSADDSIAADILAFIRDHGAD